MPKYVIKLLNKYVCHLVEKAWAECPVYGFYLTNDLRPDMIFNNLSDASIVFRSLCREFSTEPFYIVELKES